MSRLKLEFNYHGIGPHEHQPEKKTSDKEAYPRPAREAGLRVALNRGYACPSDRDVETPDAQGEYDTAASVSCGLGNRE